jgi:signal transduction histidine kinase
MSDHDQFLKNVYFFRDLSHEEIALIGSTCAETSFAQGGIVFHEGDRPNRFYIVLEGEVEIWKDFAPEGGEGGGDLLAVRGPGDLFGEMALVDDLPRSATARARGQTKLLCIERDDFHRIIHENTSVAISVLRSVSLMVRRSNETFVESLRSRNQELERAYRELKETQEELLRAERLSTLGKFSSLILHDIRNPISIVRGSAEMIIHRPDDQERAVRNARRIVMAADRLNRLAGELLDYSRGEIRLNMQIVDLAELVDSLFSQIEERMATRGIALERDLQFTGPVLLDRERILRVLLNLADNARKAMPEGGVFGVSTREESGSYLFVVRDTGVGMTADVQKRMFEPFFSHSEGGTGLGMSIVKSIVEAHEGRLTVDSRRFGGTEFRISLPKYS